MDHRHVAAVVPIGQVRVEGDELLRREHPLVDEDSGGERADVDALGLPEARVVSQRRPRVLADDVEGALEGILVDVLPSGHEELLDLGHVVTRRRAEIGAIGVDGHAAPTEHLLPLLAHHALEGPLHVTPLVGVAGKKDVAGREAPHLGELYVEVADGRLPEEGVGKRRQDPGAIAGVVLGAGRPAVVHVLQHLFSVEDDLMGTPAVDVDHETHSAGFVLEARIVEGGLFRKIH